ncbi:transposase family protein [Streptomyces sp. NBC_00076]|uniref:transposase family protein n=1 Tax=Streptomyces sp. NBC_00076 TaxID=2975642 RepID=UPI0038672157
MASKTVEDVLFPGIDVGVEGVSDASGILVVEAVSTARPGRCPNCRKQARRVHSTYQRTLDERPLGSRRVVIRLRVRRYFCDVVACSERYEADHPRRRWPSPGVFFKSTRPCRRSSDCWATSRNKSAAGFRASRPTSAASSSGPQNRLPPGSPTRSAPRSRHGRQLRRSPHPCRVPLSIRCVPRRRAFLLRLTTPRASTRPASPTWSGTSWSTQPVRDPRPAPVAAGAVGRCRAGAALGGRPPISRERLPLGATSRRSRYLVL